MSTNVVGIGCITKLDIPPEKTLRAALDHDLKEVIVIGADSNGYLYFALSSADAATNLWMLEIARKKLLEADE